MAKCPTSYIPYIEQVLESTPELAKKFIVREGVKIKVGDIVKCTYLEKLHKITKIYRNRKIQISPIDNLKESYPVSSKYVRLYEGNSKAVKILFESK